MYESTCALRHICEKDAFVGEEDHTFAYLFYAFSDIPCVLFDFRQLDPGMRLC